MSFKHSEEETKCSACGLNRHWVRVVSNDTGEIVSGNPEEASDSELLWCPLCEEMGFVGDEA